MTTTAPARRAGNRNGQSGHEEASRLSDAALAAMAGDRLVSEPVLREQLSLSKSTLRRLRAEGLPHVGTERLRRYPVAGVLRWLGERGAE